MGQARVHAGPAAGQLVERARLALGGGHRAVVVEPATQLLGQELGPHVVGHVRRGTGCRQAVDVHQVADPVGEGLGDLQRDPATLRVPEDRQGLVADGVQDGQRVANVGVPGVQAGVLGVAVAPVVPGHDPPPAGGQHRREHVERAGEVEPAVGQQEGGRLLVAPLDDVDGQPVGAHGSLPVRAPRARVGHRPVVAGVCRHLMASALGGEATPARRLSGAEVKKHS